MSDRAAFEAWLTSYGGGDSCWIEGNPQAPGTYMFGATNAAWATWQEAARQEREACAVVCECLHMQTASYFAAMGSAGMPEYDAKDCAAAIRSRGEK